MPDQPDHALMGFPIKTVPNEVIDRESMKAKRIEIIGGFVFAQSADGSIYLSEVKPDQ